MKTITCYTTIKLKPELNVGCCSSCHEDHEEYGYSLCEFYYSDITIEVCCSVASQLTEEIQEELVQRIKAIDYK